MRSAASAIQGVLKAIAKIGLFLVIYHPLRVLILWFIPKSSGAKTKPVLIVQMDNVGDLILATGTLKHYQAAFPGREVILVCPQNHASLMTGLFPKTIGVDRKKFRFNLFYSIRVLAALKRLSPEILIHHSTIPFSTIEYFSLLTLAGAKHTVGYAGEPIFADPRGQSMYERTMMVLAYPLCRQKLDELVPSLDVHDRGASRLTSSLAHYKHLFESITGFKAEDYSLHLGDLKLEPPPTIPLKRYCVMGLGAAVAYRRWPPERFAEISSKILQAQDITTVLAGGKQEGGLVRSFIKIFPNAKDLTGTSLLELTALIKYSLLVISNETSYIPIAIALSKPSVCVLGGGHLGRCSLYGYPDINKWVYDEHAPCLGDNWMCGKSSPPNTPSPCIASVSEEIVATEVRNLLVYLGGTSGRYPQKLFYF